MKKKIVIIGSGGHGKVVADAVLQSDQFELIGFADDHAEIGKNVIGKYTVVAKTDDHHTLKLLADCFIVAIGNNGLRKKIFETLSSNLDPATEVHPFSSISPFAELGKGVSVLAGAVVSANVRIGDNCIINVHSLVDHDSLIGNHTHISQGAIVQSYSTVPENFTYVLKL